MEKKARAKTEKQLLLENRELRSRLAEAGEALDAIRNGEVDAIAVYGDNGKKVFSLASAETPYRVIVEEMSEGAVVLSKDGLILYCNSRFAELVSVPLEQISGSYFTRFVEESYRSRYDAMMRAGLEGKSNGEIACFDRDNNPVPLHLSFRRLPPEMPGDVCIVATDISALRQNEKELRQYHDTLEQRVLEKTAELTKTIEDLAASHLAVMNMMEDAVAANKALEKSESTLRAIFENANDGILAVDPETLRFVFANEGICRMLGYDLAEMQNLEMKDLHPAEEYQYAMEQFQQQLQGESLMANDIPMKRKDGSILYAEINSAVVILGGRQCIIGFFRDITGRKQSEQELRESKALIDAVVENIPLMIFLKEAKDLRFVVFNRAGEELLGYDRGDLLGKNNLDLFPPEQAEHFMAKDREVLDGEKDMLDIPEEPIDTARKGRRLLHTRKVRIHGSDGTTKYLLGISEDITERKQAEETLQQKYDELERFNKVTVDREVRMIELKAEINALLKAAGQPEKYKIVNEQDLGRR